MWLLTILLFLLTCIFMRLQFNKIMKHCNSLNYEITELKNKLKNDDKE